MKKINLIAIMLVLCTMVYKISHGEEIYISLMQSVM
jgi:hypothetical protein